MTVPVMETSCWLGEGSMSIGVPITYSRLFKKQKTLVLDEIVALRGTTNSYVPCIGKLLES